MKISVLIAIDGGGAFVADALSSLRAQIHADWELIVTECGPRESTEQVVHDFSVISRQPVHFSRLTDKHTVAAARNRLLELATGDWVAFLEPNDTWTPQHLTNAVPHLSEGADVVVSDVRVFDPRPGGGETETTAPPPLSTNPIRTLFTNDAIPEISSVVFRREVGERAGKFDERFTVGEGRDFWLRCAIKGARFAATHRTTCHSVKQSDDGTRALQLAESAVLFFDKHHDLASVPAALRRRLLAASLVTQGQLLRATDPSRAARCFLRAWSLQPVHVQTLGQFALTGWRSSTGNPQKPDPRRSPKGAANGTAEDGS